MRYHCDPCTLRRIERLDKPGRSGEDHPCGPGAAMNRRSGVGANRDQSYALPDIEWVHQDLGKANVTLVMLWEEYAEDCVAYNMRYYGET